MSKVPPPTTGGALELGALLVLLHDAADPFRTVHATYRVWRHEERLLAAFRADAEEKKLRGASLSSVSAVSSGDPEPPETEETVRIWRDGARLREEHQGGRCDGYYGVTDGPLWWFWDPRMGAMSNEDDPSVGSGVGQQLKVMLNPTPLLGALHFRVTGNSQVAGRATVTAHGTARPRDPRHGRAFELHELGAGAHHYQLEVDQDRGVLLAVTAIRDEQPFHQITTLAIGFDEPIPAGIFHFAPPPGEQIQPTRDRRRLRPITVGEAQQRAPFTILVPDRVPASWRVHCVFVDASQRPPAPAQVMLSYRSDDGHQSISISQMAAAEASQQYGQMTADENWLEVAHDGAPVRVRPAEWGQAQAYLERAGTFVFVVSEDLTGEQLATIAAGLRPAPNVGTI